MKPTTLFEYWTCGKGGTLHLHNNAAPYKR